MGEVLTRVYRNGILEAENFPVADVSDWLDRPDSIVWVDLFGASKDDLDELAGELGLHDLAVEDALGPHQRPKLDRYPTHLFLSCHAVHVGTEGQLEETEIDAFIGERWLITVRKNHGFSMDPVLERWDRAPDLTTHGVSFLLYALLDIVVDSYFEAIQAFDEYYEGVSEGIFAEQPLDPGQQRRWFDVRRAMVRFHRLVAPLREVVSSLMRRESTAVPEELIPYFRDLYDHILRVGESADSLRELVSTIVETNLSLRDYRQNQVVKLVSSWAAIAAVPALITGYYGMNVPFPGSGELAGVAMSLALMIGSSMGLYVLFRRNGWL